jgi:hypothetical protein
MEKACSPFVCELAIAAHDFMTPAKSLAHRTRRNDVRRVESGGVAR